MNENGMPALPQNGWSKGWLRYRMHPALPPMWFMWGFVFLVGFMAGVMFMVWQSGYEWRMPGPAVQAPPASIAAPGGQVLPPLRLQQTDTTLPQPSGGVYTRDQMAQVLRSAGWPEAQIDNALEVTYCESGWNPSAVGDGGDSLGLFQINTPAHVANGFDTRHAFDPIYNAQFALRLWQSSGWGPWSCAHQNSDWRQPLQPRFLPAVADLPLAA